MWQTSTNAGRMVHVSPVTFVTAIVFVLLTFGLARAVGMDDSQVVSSISTRQLMSILDTEGYASATITENGNVAFKIEGSNALLLIADDRQSIQFYAGWKNDNTDLAKVNKWNKSKRYSRAYLDDTGDPCLELDLDLTGGVTVARIKDFLHTCRTSFLVFQLEVL